MTDLIVREESPMAAIMQAMQSGADLEKLERALTLQERWEANQAKKAYIEAMAQFKENLPKVYKDKFNAQYKSPYASEDALMSTLNPVLAQYGLDVSFNFPPAPDPKFLCVTCVLRHRGGHQTEVALTGPVDTSGSKNPLQQVKSTVTYLRKATYEAVLGIATSEKGSDDDGNSSAAIQTITVDQALEIDTLIQETGTKLPEFLKWIKTDCIDNIPATSYQKVITALNKKKAMREPGSEG